MVKKIDLIAWVEGSPERLAKWNAEEGNGGTRSVADYLQEYCDRRGIVNDLASDLGYPEAPAANIPTKKR